MVELHDLDEAPLPQAAPLRNTPNSALQFIRRVTAPLHECLDQGSVLSCLARPDCSLLEYQHAMVGLAQAYRQADGMLATAPANATSNLPPYTPRWPLIAVDLAGLGMSFPALSAPHAGPTTWAHYLGMRYVVEGASLGAKVITRNLTTSPIASQLPQPPVFWGPSLPWQGCWPLLMHALSGLSSP